MLIFVTQSLEVMIKRKNLIPSVFLGLLLFMNFLNSKIYGKDEKGSIIYGGLKRTWLIHIPQSYVITIPSPLLIVLHGGGGTGRNMVKLTRGGFNKISDNKGFIVVYPDGIDKHWEDGRTGDETGYKVHKKNVDDVGFISAMIDHLIKKMNLDAKRVYVTGMSNGAIMSYCLGCRLSYKIAAIAPVAGNIPLNLVASCKPSGPVSVLALNSVNDPLVPFTGGDITGPFGIKKLGKVISARESVKFWVINNKCSESPVITCGADKDPSDGTRVRIESYQYGVNQTEVILYIIEGGGHTWPGGYQYLGKGIIGRTSRDIDANEVIWDFFEKHSLE
jgi:polyhydroxybutyrate depolymerase